MGEERHMNGAIRRALAGQSRKDAGPCPDLNLVAAYLEGNLSRCEREGIEAHASSCPACQHLLALSLRLSDAELPGTEEAAAAPPVRKVLFRFSIPVAAVAALALAAGLVAILTWQYRSDKTATTEIAQLGATRAPASQIAEREGPPPSTVRREAEPNVVTGRSDLADRKSTEMSDQGLGLPAKAPVRPGVPQDVSEADKPVQREAAAAAASAPEPPSSNVEALQRVAAVAPKADREAVGGLPGGVVGGIMAPRPLEESREQTTQATTLQVADQAVREQAGFKALAKDEVAEGKEKAGAAALDAAATGAPQRGNPREAVQTLASALKGGADDDQMRARSNRQYSIVAGSRTGERTRLISGRTFLLHAGYWIDLECTKHLEGDVADLPARGPERDQVREAIPEIEELIKSGVPVVMYWKEKSVVLR